MDKVLTIGVAGGTGSGKTTVTRRLQRIFGRDVSVLYHDDYYKRRDELSYEERTHINYDEPDAFDTDLLIGHLDALCRGEEIRCPVYDFTVHNRSDSTKVIESAPVIIVEGILILAEPELAERLDIKVYVDADADVRILRRIVRDVRDRGRSLESVINQYLSTVKPMHELYVEPSRKRADIIIPGGGHNEVALDMLSRQVRSHLQEVQRLG